MQQQEEVEMATVAVEIQTPADRRFGYPFSVNGLMSQEEAAKHLGGLSHDTLHRLYVDGKIRKGKHERKIVYCRRSIEEYGRSIEV